MEGKGRVKMKKTEMTIDTISIPTYPEPPAEKMPMFAENRVHQRTSGNPYPCRVVVKVDRSKKTNQEYTRITLENEYLKIEILPELGGRIYAAKDKRTGYDFFYKQHVIKPALIGCLGSWVSGGLEFNWPFHHRPSTFMPVDYSTEYSEDGTATVWLSEHDPMERTKGMVGISLKPGETIFHTRMKLTNRTPVASSFLWWENAAVPVNKSYQIFFPKDVTYVNFHYKRSVTTYPVASNATGVFNGIRYEGETDISMHKNTVQPTSYFSAESKFDFFGGYDHAKQCGVVHVANHHISPGKKMFTWAYNQLSKSWEKALTDTDGEYAELMAGSYSDNQPDFAWIEPYETKQFTQSWFPISGTGVPVFANENGAIGWEKDRIILSATKVMADASVTVYSEDGSKTEYKTDLTPDVSFTAENNGIKRITVTAGGVTLMDYTAKQYEPYHIPAPREDAPNFKDIKTAQELYLEGLHVKQYRDPAIRPDSFWREALQRDSEYVPALLAMAEYKYQNAFYAEALEYAQKAVKVLSRCNERHKSGYAYYLTGLILLACGERDNAYDAFYKASWNMDSYSAAMTQIAAIDGCRNDWRKMREHSENALRYNTENPLAGVYLAIAHLKSGKPAQCAEILDGILGADPLNHLARYTKRLCGGTEDFFAQLRSDPEQTCMDVAFDLMQCGCFEEAEALLKSVKEPSAMLCYVLGDDKQAINGEIRVFPFRHQEIRVLRHACERHPDDGRAAYLLGCALYAKGHYEEGAALFERASQSGPDRAFAYRNLAIAAYSHLGQKDKTPELLSKALELEPENDQLVFETAYVMGKLGVPAQQRIDFIKEHEAALQRDDVCLELVRAYNLGGMPEKTLELMNGHAFVPCEGGEHAVAEQYMSAYYLIGRNSLKQGEYEKAAKALQQAQILPENLGAGLWNECKTVPHKYYLAQALEQMGKQKEAKEIYEYILVLTVDYFSNMHLPELPYYQAMASRKLGRGLQGRAIMDTYLKQWETAIGKEDPGYFGTTPFFLSYCDDAKTARTSYFSYLLGYANRYMGNAQASQKYFAAARSLDPLNLSYQIESEFSDKA